MKSVYTLGSVIFFLNLTACLESSNKILPVENTPLNKFINNSAGLTPVENLGKLVFFDPNLSSPVGQSCASCHNPFYACSDPSHQSVSEGAVKGQFGTRNAPALTYLSFAPTLFYSQTDSTYVGGLFWDGRAKSLEDQAHFPLLNPSEMNNSDSLDIVTKIAAADYATNFQTLYGNGFFDDKNKAFKVIMNVIASYEKSFQFKPFTSKYDYYLNGQTDLTAQELRGLDLFNGDKAKCINCHPSDVGDFGAVLFTDFTYDNIGLPSNAKQQGPRDLGLAVTTNDPAQNGRFKVPSLRNVTLTAPYFHNGFFTNLKDAVRFYSQRDIPGKFPAPEVPETVNKEELGNLNLTEEEMDDIVAFLNTLTDGYQP